MAKYQQTVFTTTSSNKNCYLQFDVFFAWKLETQNFQISVVIYMHLIVFFINKMFILLIMFSAVLYTYVLI